MPYWASATQEMHLLRWARLAGLARVYPQTQGKAFPEPQPAGASAGSALVLESHVSPHLASHWSVVLWLDQFAIF